MDKAFVRQVSLRPASHWALSLDSLLLFSRSEWIDVAQSRAISTLLQWITVFIFVLWSADSLANRHINWASYQYPVVFALFSLIFLAKGANRKHLVPLAIVGIVIFFNAFCIATALTDGAAVFSELNSNLVLYMSPVAIANSVLFKPRIALWLNLLIVVCLGYGAAGAIMESPLGLRDLQLVVRILGVTGFCLWFAVAQFIAFTLYMRHRLELVEVHHLVAEMERNQRLSEENTRIRDDLLRTQRVQMVDSMTSTMAHEVNQPISCANNFIQAARRWLSRPQPDVAEALVSLHGAQDEILRVSERVTAIRRLMQRLSSEYTGVDLTELVRRAEVLLRRDLGVQQIEVKIDLPDDGDDYVIFGADEELTQVLLNLVANAVDACMSRTHDRRIDISLRPADLGELQLVVADNGCGIPSTNLGQVFERLYSTKAGGSGLGLPLCQRIVSNHGGTIAIESRLDHGTRVIMRFPRAEMRSRIWGDD